MAHQAHAIRWNVLVAHLQYQPQLDLHTGKRCDIVFGFQGNQGKDVAYSANSFARNITRHTITERAKYPDICEPPETNNILISEKTAQRIVTTVYKWRRAYAKKIDLPVHPRNGIGHHDQDTTEPLPADSPRQKKKQQDSFSFACTCPVSLRERKASAFL
ncbi:hypothetical protein BJY04DRAFT_185517 [Aspergillus karnatakaensis]|uniref:uncharacterized protein n=1 Tax=Aspergillus karnatakaensis TaxID=1810916 RepID=UPI003CCD0E4A